MDVVAWRGAFYHVLSCLLSSADSGFCLALWSPC